MLLAVLDVLLLLLAGLVLVPVLVFCGECLLSLLPVRRMPAVPAEGRPTVVVLVPAHNEEQTLLPTLRALSHQLRAGDRIVVVADNCDDRTAEVAREAGAVVIERQDPQRRGKGFALDFGVRYLEQSPPDVVVIVDADCEVREGGARRLADLAHDLGRPVQAHYVGTLEDGGRSVYLVSALAFRFRGLVRVLGLARLGLPCHLMGTGMAFPWSQLREAPLASSNLVEDMQLGIDLLIAGHPPVFCPEVEVVSRLPQEHGAFVSQRRRWEHGHLQTALSGAPRLLAAAFRQRRPSLLATALDLCVPPLALLVVLWAVALTGAVAGGAVGASWLPAALLAGGGGMMGLCVLLGWLKYCRREVPWFVFLLVPLYILRKLPIYFGLLHHRQRDWVRTERKSESQPTA